MRHVLEKLLGDFECMLNQHLLWADVSQKQLTLYKFKGVGWALQKTYPCSSSIAPQSCYMNSLGTPYGLHRICEKIGHAMPVNGVFKYRHFTGIVCPPSKICTDGFVTTRILRLSGLEWGINRGKHNTQCCDTYRRCVYIHGTNLEYFIPNALSRGCLLLSNKNILELFEQVYEGDYVYITPPEGFHR